MKFMFEKKSNNKFQGRKWATIHTTINYNIKKTKRRIILTSVLWFAGFWDIPSYLELAS